MIAINSEIKEVNNFDVLKGWEWFWLEEVAWTYYDGLSLYPNWNLKRI